VQTFKRLFFAQVTKARVAEGQVHVAERLAAFAALSRELVIAGIDDHFEIWDAARWRRYTQSRKNADE